MELDELIIRRNETQTAMNAIGPMRTGSLTERYIRCGKIKCQCKDDGHRGHGPVYSYSKKDETTNKTVIQYFQPGEQLNKLKQEIENYHTYKRLYKEYLKVNNEICKATENISAKTKQDQTLKKNSSRK